MRILVVAATDAEVAPLLARMDHASGGDTSVRACTYGAHDVDVLVTGVGMVATAVWCSRALTLSHYDLVLNLGVCGSFDASLNPGTVVHVVADRLAELGAEDDDRLLTLEELSLPGESRFVNPAPPANPALGQLPSVTGITVNTVHGSQRSIEAAARRFSPQVESMEGAAFMSACLIHQVAFAQVRAVSNLVEPRRREAWKMAEAVANLTTAGLRILDQA